MASITLGLGGVVLIDSAAKLKVSAGCAGSFQVPYFISTLNHVDILQAFESGHIYTTRGIGCSLDIRVLSEGNPLDVATRDAILDKLGNYLLDSKIWPRLGLLPALKLDAVPSELDISLSLRHLQSKGIGKAGPRTRLLEKTDLTPPKDVCQAELQSLRLDLDFIGIREPKEVGKGIGQPSHTKIEIRLVDQVKQISDHLEDLESVVKEIRSLPLVVAKNFEQDGPNLPGHAVATARENASGSDLKDDAPTPNSEAIQSASNSKHFFFSKEITQTLRVWLASHSDHPYPTPLEWQELIDLTGLNRVQIYGWLRRNRKRLGSILSQQDEEEMLFSAGVNGDDEDDVDLLSQPLDGESSHISEVSETSPSLLSESSQATTIEEPQVRNQRLETAVTKLVDGALKIFIRGYYRRMPLPPGVKLEKPAPEICLSKLVPNMFNPGYREFMAYNFQFVSNIVRFIANPLPEHLQPDILKEKMAQLAAMPISPIPGYEVHESTDAINHRTRVVETRIFTMMQRTLYDAAATRKVWKKDKNELTAEAPQDEESDPELLDQGDDVVRNTNWDDLLARYTSDEEFNGLLLDDDEDDDLLDETGRERLEIERAVDEMLFGGHDRNENEEDDHYLLSGGESDDERYMLL